MNSATAERQTKTIAMAANFLRSAAMANSFDAQMIAMAFDGPPEIPILVTAPMFGPLIGHLELRSPGFCVRWTVVSTLCLFRVVCLFVRCVCRPPCVSSFLLSKTPSRSKSFPFPFLAGFFSGSRSLAGSRAAAAVSFSSRQVNLQQQKTSSFAGRTLTEGARDGGIEQGKSAGKYHR